jgi:hypothetical protein
MAAQMIETSIVRARGTRDRGLGARGQSASFRGRSWWDGGTAGRRQAGDTEQGPIRSRSRDRYAF